MEREVESCERAVIAFSHCHLELFCNVAIIWLVSIVVLHKAGSTLFLSNVENLY